VRDRLDEAERLDAAALGGALLGERPEQVV